MTQRTKGVIIQLVQNIELKNKKGEYDMAFDYNKLRGRIIEKFGSQVEFAKAMNWSERTLSKKINGKVQWKQADICNAIKLLEISKDDIQEYFFKLKVQNIEL